MRPRPSKPKDVERIARSLGFEFTHQKGSHRHFKDPATGRRLVIPFHGGSRDVPTGTLRSILAQMGVTAEEFNGKV